MEQIKKEIRWILNDKRRIRVGINVRQKWEDVFI